MTLEEKKVDAKEFLRDFENLTYEQQLFLAGGITLLTVSNSSRKREKLKHPQKTA